MIIWSIYLIFKCKSMSLKEFKIKPICCWPRMSTWNDPAENKK